MHELGSCSSGEGGQRQAHHGESVLWRTCRQRKIWIGD